jgi:hypothetical protein
MMRTADTQSNDRIHRQWQCSRALNFLSNFSLGNLLAPNVSRRVPGAEASRIRIAPCFVQRKPKTEMARRRFLALMSVFLLLAIALAAPPPDDIDDDEVTRCLLWPCRVRLVGERLCCACVRACLLIRSRLRRCI